MKDRAYENARNCKYGGCQRADKKTRSEVSVNEVIKKIIRGKVYARFKDNIWAADLAEMGSLSSKNKNVKYSLCVIDIFTKYAWVKPL